MNKFMNKHSVKILTGAAIIGCFTTGALTFRGYMQSRDVLDSLEDSSFFNRVKKTYKYYIPAASIGAISAVCIFGANNAILKKQTSAIAMYKASEKYLSHVLNEINPEEKEKIYDSFVKKLVNENDVDVELNDPEFLFDVDELYVPFLDSWTGRLFKSTQENIKRAQNDLNYKLISGTDSFITVNEFYNEIGIPPVDSGDHLGWSLDNKMEVGFDTTSTEKGVPCMVLKFNIEPAPWLGFNK